MFSLFCHFKRTCTCDDISIELEIHVHVHVACFYCKFCFSCTGISFIFTKHTTQSKLLAMNNKDVHIYGYTHIHHEYMRMSI